MFARTAARSFRPVVSPLQATSKRFASGAPASGKERRYLRDMPVDVYPLAFLVTVVCSGSIYMCAHHLITDKGLRLLPDSARGEAKKH